MMEPSTPRKYKKQKVRGFVRLQEKSSGTNTAVSYWLKIIPQIPAAKPSKLVDTTNDSQMATQMSSGAHRVENISIVRKEMLYTEQVKLTSINEKIQTDED